MHDKIQIFTERDSGVLQTRINDYIAHTEGPHEVDIVIAQSQSDYGLIVNYVGTVYHLSKPRSGVTNFHFHKDEVELMTPKVTKVDEIQIPSPDEEKLQQLDAIFKSFKSSLAFAAPEMFEMHIDTLHERIKGLFD